MLIFCLRILLLCTAAVSSQNVEFAPREILFPGTGVRWPPVIRLPLNPNVPSVSTRGDVATDSFLDVSPTVDISMPGSSDIPTEPAESIPLTGGRRNFILREQPPCAQFSSLPGMCDENVEVDPEVQERFHEALLKKAADFPIFNDTLVAPIVSPTISTRIGETVDEFPVCKTTSRIIYPTYVRIEQGSWIFMGNNRTHKVQGIRVELCIGPNEPCDVEDDRTRCVQNHITKVAYGLSDDGEDLQAETILVPSCCICMKRKFTFRGEEPSNDIGGTSPSDTTEEFRRQ